MAPYGTRTEPKRRLGNVNTVIFVWTSSIKAFKVQRDWRHLEQARSHSSETLNTIQVVKVFFKSKPPQTQTFAPSLSHMSLDAIPDKIACSHFGSFHFTLQRNERWQAFFQLPGLSQLIIHFCLWRRIEKNIKQFAYYVAFTSSPQNVLVGSWMMHPDSTENW